MAKPAAVTHKKTIVGVIGASAVSEEVAQVSEALGAAIAAEGWVTLTGGEPFGVMELALKGAVEAGGETLAILPQTKDKPYSPYATIPVFTSAGLARDYFNVLTADVIVVVGPVSAGTLIEVAYALKKQVPLILLAVLEDDADLVTKRSDQPVHVVNDVSATTHAIKQFL